MNTVLIGFAEALTAPETFFSLRSAGYNVRIFCRKGTRPLIAKRLPVGPPLEVCAPEENAVEAIADITRHLHDCEDIDAVMALDDPGLWLLSEVSATQDLPDRIKIVGATGRQADIALDKRQQIDIARESGFTVPPTVIANSYDEIRQSSLLPCIVKPALVAGVADNRLRKGKSHFLERPEDVERLCSTRDAMFPAVVQALVRGQGEGVFGLAHADGVSAWSGHRRLRMMNPHGSGASACEACAATQDTRDATEAFIAAIGWRGTFMIELLRSEDGVAHFVELNGRPWGSTALARRGGFEYPLWAVQLRNDDRFRPPEPVVTEGLSVRHLGRDLVHLLFVLRGPKSAFHAVGWPSLWTTIRRVFAPTRLSRFYNYDPEFPSYFLHDALHALRKLLARRSID